MIDNYNHIICKKYMRVIIFICIAIFMQCCSYNGKHNTLSYNNSDFTEISKVIPDVIYDIRYYSDYNFTGKRVDGYKANRAYLTKKAALALKNAADDLRKQGYRIIIYDAYRPQKAVDNFVRWMHDENDIGNKSFYPNIKDKLALISGDYVATKSGHTRGSVVDMSIVNMDGSTVDMGGTFDLFDRISNRDYDKLTEKQKANRKILEDAMVDAGFEPLPSEWWHFRLKDEPYPDTYFDFDVE